jgi:GntR family galactonate operon transcriptional repressor
MTSSTFAPRRVKRSLKEQLVDDIGGDIARGVLKPGEILPGEETLLKRYGVSRTVLRAALNSLSAKGFVDARQKRGTAVLPQSRWNTLDPAFLDWHDTADLREILPKLIEMRRIIEPAAAALAAKRATDDDLARISAAYEGMERAEGVMEAFIEADLAFHTGILLASHNEFLLPVVHAVRTAMMASLRVTNTRRDENRHVSLPLHRAILDALIARDPPAAAAAMQRHLDDTEQRRLKALGD